MCIIYDIDVDHIVTYEEMKQIHQKATVVMHQEEQPNFELLLQKIEQLLQLLNKTRIVVIA